MLKAFKEFIFDFINYYYRLFRKDKLKDVIRVTEGYEVIFAEDEKSFLAGTHLYRKQYFDYSKGYVQKEGYLAKMHDVQFLGNSCAVVRNKKILIDSQYDEFRLMNSSAYRWPAFLRSKKRTGAYTCVSLFPQGYNNIYHWLIDCLPRTFLLEHIPEGEEIILLINDDAPLYQLETARFFTERNKRFKLQTFRRKEKLHLPVYWFPGFLSNHKSGYLPPSVIEYLRSTIMEGYGIIENRTKRKIYISRQNASKRRILNEAEVIEELVKKGVEIVLAETLTFKEQVELFVNSKYILGCHGAGFTNILFSKDAHIFEIHPSNDQRSHYFLLSKGCKHHYEYFLGGESMENEDFTVDMELFKLKLQAFLNSNKNVIH
jgi:hypothetical protein